MQQQGCGLFCYRDKMTRTEIEAELTELNTAISHILKGGQSYTIMSASGAGTQRVVTMADYSKLLGRKKELQRMLDTIDGYRGIRLGVGW